jgi:hypothetical protein
LILSAQESDTWGEPRWTMALEMGAAQEPVSGLQSVRPTENGLTPEEPAIFGHVVTAENWQLQPITQARGKAAWEMIRTANRYNDPPPVGMQYMAIELMVRHVADDEERVHAIGEWEFRIRDDHGVLHTPPPVVAPEPPLDALYLYPGGDTTGWIVMQAPVESQDPVLVFMPPDDHRDMQWRYISLRQTGR